MIATLNFKSVFQSKSSDTLFDLPLLYAMICLIGVGFVMVTSASMPVAERLYDNPYHIIVRHGMFLIMGMVLFWLSTSVSMTWWKRFNPYLLLFGMALLVLVLVVGREVNGAKRWIPVGPVGIQAAEVAKLYFISYIAGYLVR